MVSKKGVARAFQKSKEGRVARCFELLSAAPPPRWSRPACRPRPRPSAAPRPRPSHWVAWRAKRLKTRFLDNFDRFWQRRKPWKATWPHREGAQCRDFSIKCRQEGLFRPFEPLNRPWRNRVLASARQALCQNLSVLSKKRLFRCFGLSVLEVSPQKSGAELHLALSEPFFAKALSQVARNGKSHTLHFNHISKLIPGHGDHGNPHADQSVSPLRIARDIRLSRMVRVAVVLDGKAALPEKVAFEMAVGGELARCCGNLHACVHLRRWQSKSTARTRERKKARQDGFSGRRGVRQNEAQRTQSNSAPSPAGHFFKISCDSFWGCSGIARKKPVLDERRPSVEIWRSKRSALQKANQLLALGEARVTTTEFKAVKHQFFEQHLPRGL